MDYIKRFDIEIDKTLYYAGELLTGHVLVETIENIKVQSIRVFIRGKAHCQWKITRAGEKRTVKEDEYYMDYKILLWGKGSSEEGPVSVLHRGSHKFPIEYQIPETNLPCSFESKIGRIRYYLRVVINIPYASHPQGIKYFSIIGPHIDCMDSGFLTPTTVTDKRKSCCFCLFGGPIVLKATMERSAYCCGEKIKLKAEVQNGCDQKVWLICRLMQHVDYFINRGVLGLTKEHTTKVWEYQSETVQPHQSVNFDQLQDHLQVPITPPTLIDVCGLIKVYYELVVSLGMERSSEDLELYLPITVATVPFRIPNMPAPQLHFEFASPMVEGGMYISPEFQLGQVYMGDDDEENDETILYRPVYCAIQHNDMTVTNTNNAPAPSCNPPFSSSSPNTLANPTKILNVRLSHLLNEAEFSDEIREETDDMNKTAELNQTIVDSNENTSPSCSKAIAEENVALLSCEKPDSRITQNTECPRVYPEFSISDTTYNDTETPHTLNSPSICSTSHQQQETANTKSHTQDISNFSQFQNAPTRTNITFVKNDLKSTKGNYAKDITKARSTDNVSRATLGDNVDVRKVKSTVDILKH